MKLYILIAYFILNLVIGLALHLRTSRRTVQRLKPMELVVYFVVVLLIGLPLFILMKIRGEECQSPDHRHWTWYQISARSTEHGFATQGLAPVVFLDRSLFFSFEASG